LGLETALEEKISEAFDKFFEVDGVGGFAGVFAVADEFHEVSPGSTVPAESGSSIDS
jgi:hypothetical protein